MPSKDAFLLGERALTSERMFVRSASVNTRRAKADVRRCSGRWGGGGGGIKRSVSVNGFSRRVISHLKCSLGVNTARASRIFFADSVFDIRWSRDNAFKLIEMYRSSPCLRDPQHPEYEKNAVENDAWTTVCEPLLAVPPLKQERKWNL
ncbi:hypothetical protein PR048_021844 [Dryococelus australis]|uniref:MADF domain-containing protein n=1 Tax=Dryococelus australis TaxID=614101 RepID=A0ABQ9GZE8_9NEOP|nr:hypothetical protein PR048_021844 [Dryococelus australis]